MKKFLTFILLLTVAGLTSYGQPPTPVGYYEYWFDDDFAARKSVTDAPAGATLTVQSADAAALADGVNSIRFRARDDDGAWTVVYTQRFIKIQTGESIVVSPISDYEYWFDNDFAARKKLTAGSPDVLLTVQTADAAALADGVHSLRFRASDDAGQWTVVYTQRFIKAQTGSSIAVSPISDYEYWFDDDFAARKKLTAGSPNALLTMQTADAGALDYGVHSLRFRARDEAGKWTVVHTQRFYKAEFAEAVKNLITGYRYWFDDGEQTTVTLDEPVNPCELNANILLPEDLDEQLPHTFTILFVDANDKWSHAQTATFTMGTVEPVTEITLDIHLEDVEAGTPVVLAVTVEPEGATNQTVVWTVKDAGTTGAVITDNVLNTTGAGTVTITATITDGKGIGEDYTKDFVLTVAPAFEAVTEIALDVSLSTITAGAPVTLAATITPDNATNQTVVWTVKDAGTTGASITGNVLNTTGDGTVTITATIVNGSSKTTSFTKDFTITVETAFVAVTDITGVPSSVNAKTPLTLTATVTPANATNQTIVWSVKSAGATGAAITGATLNTTAAGSVTITATIANGASKTTAFTKDFTITVSAVTGVSEMERPNPLKAWTRGGLLHVTGLTSGETLSVYNAAGALVYRNIASADETDIPLTVQGVYMVRQGDFTIKVSFL